MAPVRSSRINPQDRLQNVTALVSGRIERWYVQDGSLVKEGDPIVQITDNDPLYIERLKAERELADWPRLPLRKAQCRTAQLDVGRTGTLLNEGLASRRDYELTRIKVAQMEATLAEARAAVTQIDINLAQQSLQLVRAPRDGVIQRISGGDKATRVSQGDVLASFAPIEAPRVVEIYVDGRDAPLIRPGQPVRLEFEGWPAIQFSGWPSVAQGLFDGQVQSVDLAASPNGLFRVLVRQTKGKPRWPGEPYVRLGANVRGVDRDGEGFGRLRTVASAQRLPAAEPCPDPGAGRRQRACAGDEMMVRPCWTLALALLSSVAASAIAAQAQPASQPSPDQPLPAQASPAQTEQVLQLDEVLASSRRFAPTILEALATTRAADGRVLASEGAFDLLFKGEGFSRITGFYDGTYAEGKAIQPLTTNGGQIEASYRASRGDFPTYEDYSFTNKLGELKVRGVFALLRDRHIDDRRFGQRNAQIERDIAGLDALLIAIGVQQRAIQAYGQWVAAGQQVRVYRDLLALAEERQYGIRRQVQLGARAAILLTENEQNLLRRKSLLVTAERDLANAAQRLSLFWRNDDGRPQLATPANLPRAAAHAASVCRQ